MSLYTAACCLTKGPLIIINVKLSVKHTLLGEGGINGKKMLIPYTFNILALFYHRHGKLSI